MYIELNFETILLICGLALYSFFMFFMIKIIYKKPFPIIQFIGFNGFSIFMILIEKPFRISPYIEGFLTSIAIMAALTCLCLYQLLKDNK